MGKYLGSVVALSAAAVSGQAGVVTLGVRFRNSACCVLPRYHQVLCRYLSSTRRAVAVASSPTHSETTAIRKSARKAISVGDVASVKRTFSPADVEAFATVSGDCNPVHLDAEYAAATRFGRPIVHGVLMNGVISGLLGTVMPGEGTIYMGQTISFKAPLPVGEPMVARVEVLAIHPRKPIATVATQCLAAETNDVLMDGKATVLFPKELYCDKDKNMPAGDSL